MERAQMTSRPTILRTTFASNRNDTDDLDDTLPVELLDCVDTTTNEDWLTRETPVPGEQKCASTLRISEQGGSSVFNPPLSSTRYRSDGSSEWSDISTTAECGSACDDEVRPAGFQNGDFIYSLLPAASMEFQPLRCSTSVTSDVVQKVNLDTFKIRVDTNEFKSLRKESEFVGPENMEFNPLRCSTGFINGDDDVKPKAVQRYESMNFKPLRCSTGLVNYDATEKTKVRRNESIEFLRCSTGLKTEGAAGRSVNRPASPDEFYVTACSTLNGNSARESDNAHFVTALGTTQPNNCFGRKSAESAKSPAVQVSESQISAAPKNDDLDNDLSVLLQCHLKIRNGRRLVSNFQVKPQLELSLFKNSPIGDRATTVIRKAFPSAHKLSDKDDIINDGLTKKFQPTAAKVRLALNEDDTKFPPPSSAVPTVIKLREPSNTRGKSNCGKALGNLDGRRSPDISCGNRLERAMDNLASANIQKVISALATLDSARSASVCETLVQRGLIGHVYDFLSKMNRSIAHQMACVHATSLLLDLAKFTYSRDSVWQNGERIGLLVNLMLIWAAKDNAIFLNCSTALWVFCQDETRVNVFRRFVESQNKLLEKISAKLGTKMLRPISKVPTLKPSWVDSKAQRTYESPCSAFSGLCAVLKLPTRAK